MTDQYNVIVIGGGASGMMAAGRAAERGQKVLLLEKNRRLGAKVAMSGGGRCNITNAEEQEQLFLGHYGPAKKFLFSPFSQFGVTDTFSFFESLGLPLVIQTRQRVFPKTEKATDVVRVLERYLRTELVTIRTNAEVVGFVVVDKKIVGVKVDDETVSAESYILATGGKSHPETGSTGDGFRWLKEVGHTVQDPTPTIVPLAVADAWIKSLAGVSLNDVKITFVPETGKKVALRGRVLCTHFGLSGPLILNAAGRVADMLHVGNITTSIDVFPDLDLGALDTYVTDIFARNTNKALKNVMRHIAPTGTAAAILSLMPTLDREKKVHSITKEERKMIVHLLKTLPVSVTGLMGYDRAVVADGGIDLNEIEGKTMRSRLHSNLFVTGDLLHISRPSGGYSLQLCWTTGYVAGNNA